MWQKVLPSKSNKIHYLPAHLLLEMTSMKNPCGCQDIIILLAIICYLRCSRRNAAKMHVR